MKKTVLFIIAIPVATLIQAQEPLTRGERDVQQTVIQFFEILSNRDSVGLFNYCTADIVLIEYGSTWNADTLIRKAIRSNTTTDFKRINTIDFLSTTVTKKTAWATYNLRSEITGNGKQSDVQWIETIVAVKEKKRWKIKALHSTLIKRDTK